MVSPINAQLPATNDKQAGVWPGVCITRTVIVPTSSKSPSSSNESNCSPSSVNSSPRLKIPLKTVCTSVINLPTPVRPPTSDFKYAAPDRWSAWTCVSNIHTTSSFLFLMYSITSSAEAVEVRPEAGSKSSTGSIITQASLCRSSTT